jgi:transposase
LIQLTSLTTLQAEKALEGKYVIQTEELDLSAVQAVEAYKDLSEIERSFRELKDLVEMRPIYHRRPLLGLAEGPGK